MDFFNTTKKALKWNETFVDKCLPLSLWGKSLNWLCWPVNAPTGLVSSYQPVNYGTGKKINTITSWELPGFGTRTALHARTNAWRHLHTRADQSSALLTRGDLAPFYRHEKKLWFMLVTKLSDLWSFVGSEWFSQKRPQPSLWRLQWTGQSS